MSSQKQPKDASSIYSYLSAVVIVGGFILALLNMVDMWKAILGVVAMVLLLVVLGALQLRNDDQLTETNFIEAMKMVFNKIPPLNLFLNNKSSKNKEE